MPSRYDRSLNIRGVNVDPNLTTVLPMGTTADDVLASFQQAYGVVQYDRQKSSRWPYYSYVNYPAAGAGVLNFFGVNQAQATNGQLDTNIEQPGNLGNYSFFVQGISFDIRVLAPATAPQPNIYTTDATAIYSDIVHGFVQAGYWEFRVGTNLWDQCPFPFKYCPPGDGELRVSPSQGAFAFTQAGGSPFAVTAAQSVLAYADLERRAFRRRILKNPLFLAPQQNFQAQLKFDSGAIPLLSTTVITGGASLYVGVWLDGTRFAPIG